MGNNFKKLKTKYLLIASLKSAAVGVSCGLIAVGAILLALKLCSIDIHFAFYILIGLGTAFISGGALFCILYKLCLTDKKIAERLDNEYGLNERVQTSVAFKDDNSEIVAVLKAETESTLGNLPKLPFDFKKFLKDFWYCLLCVVLALALFITALCIPARVKPGTDPEPSLKEEPDPDPLYIYDLDAQSKMYSLRRDIINSTLAQSEKTSFDEVLEDLDSLLAKTVTGEIKIRMSELTILIRTAVYAIDGLTVNANSFRKISAELNKFDENLSKAITEGVILYKSFSYTLSELEVVKGLYNRVNQNIDETTDKYYAASLEAHKFDESVSGTVTDGTQVSEFAAKLKTALTDSGVSEDDALYAAINDFAGEGLNSVLDMVGNGFRPAGLNERLKLVYGDFKTAATDAVLSQDYNCIMDVYVRRKLAAIFEVVIGDILDDIGGPYDDLIPEGGVSGDGPGGGDGPSGGGFGYGDDIYGSKDLIYDPDTGSQVEYGKVYADYYNKVDERLREDGIPQDIADFIAEYFKILQNGTEDEGSEDN